MHGEKEKTAQGEEMGKEEEEGRKEWISWLMVVQSKKEREEGEKSRAI